MGEQGGCHCQDEVGEGIITKTRWGQEGAIIVNMMHISWGLSLLSMWVTWGIDDNVDKGGGGVGPLMATWCGGVVVIVMYERAVATRWGPLDKVGPRRRDGAASSTRWGVVDVGFR